MTPDELGEYLGIYHQVRVQKDYALEKLQRLFEANFDQVERSWMGVVEEEQQNRPQPQADESVELRDT